MNKMLGAAVFAAATAIAGSAYANETLNATFGNTVTVATADGTVVASYYMSEGNTFEMETAEGRVGGSWRVDEATNQVCLTPTGGEESCSDLQDGLGVGDSWTVSADDGSTLTVTIVAGQ